MVIHLVAKDKITIATSVKEPTKGMGGQLVNFAGVFQSLAITIGLTWIAFLAFWLMSKKPYMGK